MTAADLAKFAGRQAIWRPKIAGSKNLAINVVTIDARQLYGCIDVKISPARGSGDTWVDVRFLEMEDK